MDPFVRSQNKLHSESCQANGDLMQINGCLLDLVQISLLAD